MTPAAQAIQQIRDHLGMMDKSERYEKWRMKKALELLAALPDALVGELEAEKVAETSLQNIRHNKTLDKAIAIIRKAFAGESSIATVATEGGMQTVAPSSPAPACSEIPVVDEALWEKIHDTVKCSIAIFNSQPHFVVNGIMNTIRPYLRTTEPGCPITPQSLKLHQDLFDMGMTHATKPVSLAAGAEAVKAVLDLSLVGPDTGFKAEDVARACAKAWGLKYVD